MLKLQVLIGCVLGFFQINSIAAEPHLASIELSKSESFQIPGDEKNCLLAHTNKKSSDQTTFSISSKSPVNKRLRIDVSSDQAGPIDAMIIESRDLNFYSLTRSEKIVLEAEQNFDNLSDEEYYAQHDKAEDVEGQSDPGFATFRATADDKPFADYVRDIRTNERFPAPRLAEVSVSIGTVAVKESSEDMSFEYESAQFNGQCNIAIMIE